MSGGRRITVCTYERDGETWRKTFARNGEGLRAMLSWCYGWDPETRRRLAPPNNVDTTPVPWRRMPDVKGVGTRYEVWDRFAAESPGWRFDGIDASTGLPRRGR